jgi:hypothetical protein
MYESQTPGNFSSSKRSSPPQGTSPTRRNIATDGDRSSVATLHEKPCLYQENPRLKWQLPGKGTPRNRTPSASVLSRYRWAQMKAAILDMNHRYESPQFIATIQFREVMKVSEVRNFHPKFNASLGRWRKKFGNDEIEYFLVREVDPANKLHAHLLIRTNLADPTDVLSGRVEQASNKTAHLSYCKPIDNLAGATKYVVKYLDDALPNNDGGPGNKQPLLLKKGAGLNLTTNSRKYFVKPIPELWKEWREEWLLRSEKHASDS